MALPPVQRPDGRREVPNTQRISTGLVAGVVSLLLLTLGLAPAAAAETVIDREVVQEVLVIDCGDYLLQEDRILDILTVAFIEGGALVALQLHVHGKVVRTNLDTGATSTEHPSVSVFVDFVEGTETDTGAVFNVVIQGEGIIIQDVGRVTFSFMDGIIFEAGPHESLNDPGLLCEHLR